MIEGEKTFDVTLRWPARLRSDEQSILNIPVDITNNERMRLAATAYRAYIQHAAQMELSLAENATEDDILAVVE